MVIIKLTATFGTVAPGLHVQKKLGPVNAHHSTKFGGKSISIQVPGTIRLTT